MDIQAFRIRQAGLVGIRIQDRRMEEREEDSIGFAYIPCTVFGPIPMPINDIDESSLFEAAT